MNETPSPTTTEEPAIKDPVARGCAEGCVMAAGLLISVVLFVLFPPAGFGVGGFVVVLAAIYFTFRLGRRERREESPTSNPPS